MSIRLFLGDAAKELKKIDKDVTKITGTSVGIEPELLEKPVFEEE